MEVSTDVEECASGTEKLLMELGVSNLVAPFPASTIQPASTHQVITSPNVHVSAGEDMPSSSRTFRVSSLTEALWILKVEEIQQNLSDDEELPPQVAASVRLMEAEMDVDHEKLLSGDVNFKWQRDFTAFTAVREDFLSTRWCDNDKQPLPNAKRQPLAASNQPVTDCEEKKITTKKVSTIVMKELRPGGAGSKVGDKCIDAKVKN
ncbi:hypothetical protein EVAR_90675_1 [Eumeta japonica]|uniref:Uncharacterized protein n=1 Tax=Eumeta variegata TaxID=151549 RepID=A0A4C2ADJ6_EUMVA|nr:hypothetical protein EVAR_90675_1 [Eumeta japonica]